MNTNYRKALIAQAICNALEIKKEEIKTKTEAIKPYLNETDVENLILNNPDSFEIQLTAALYLTVATFPKKK